MDTSFGARLPEEIDADDTTARRLMTVEDLDEAVKKTPSYRAPGQ